MGGVEGGDRSERKKGLIDMDNRVVIAEQDGHKGAKW